MRLGIMTYDRPFSIQRWTLGLRFLGIAGI